MGPETFFNEFPGTRSDVIVALLNQADTKPPGRQHILELGVHDGRNARNILKSLPSTRYIGVDFWRTPVEGASECESCDAEFYSDLHSKAQQAVSPYNATLVKADSQEALRDHVLLPTAWADLV